jgi:TatA/E family protein of Tat protein translocase
MGSLGWSEMALIFMVALLVFGPKKLPEIGRTLGKGLREFKKASDELKSNWEEHLREAEAPVHELKQTMQEVQSDVEASVTLPEETPHHTEETQSIAPPPEHENTQETNPNARPN